MPKCSFCGKTLKHGSGMMVIRENGKILYFDTKKCEKNMLRLNRNPRKFKWTKPKKEK